MSRRRGAFVVVTVSLMCGCLAWSQAPAPPAAPAGPAPGDVLGRIPAGCMGFVAARNVQAFTGRIDAFIKQISPMGQPLLPISVLDLIRAQSRLGESFDPRGGFALVMLDPQQYGVDLVAAITEGKGVEMSALPLVFVIPGKDPAKMLAAFGPIQDGADIKLPGLGDPPGWARQAGDYVLLSPNRKAVGALATMGKPVLTQLSAADKAMLTRNDAAVWLNFRVIGPVLDAAIVRMQKQTAELKQRLEKGEVPPFMRPQQAVMLGMGDAMASWRTMLKQLEDVTMGLRIPESGIVLEGAASFLPDSPIGKALAAYKHVAKPLLNRLPNMPYILAMGADAGPAMPEQETAKQVDQILSMVPFKDLSPEAKAKFRALLLTSQDELGGMQMFVGQNTAGAGKLGVAAVMECKSADKARQILADAVAVVAEMFQAGQDPNLKQLSVKYHKGMESLGDRKLDAIIIEHPELAKAPQSARNAMKVVLGEDKLRLYVTALDDKTLVMTMGGGKEFLAAALKAAGGTGKLAADPNVAKAVAMLPKDRVGVGVFSPQNLMKLIMDSLKDIAAAEGQQPPPIQLKVDSPDPFAMAFTMQGCDVGATGYLPATTIRDLIQVVMGMMMPAMQPGPEIAPGDDF